ncbi:BatA domain-containing protein [Chitinophaga sp. Hz27]|uniref:BatA domain-containing protein n=1 Tax=Chitinophaga sp. Hz27 TaxID=3347169 RepID=UPI0035D782EC
MLHLLQPIWMLLSAGIIIPVLIHLWHRKPGRVLRIGSIQLLKSATVRHARSLRLSELLLLLLRCAFIVLLAMLLSQPQWKSPFSKEHRGWIILEDHAYPYFKKTIDSLIESGCELHRFDTAFTRINIKHLPAYDSSSVSYRTLLKRLETLVPPDFPLYVFSGDQQKRFHGPRTSLDLTLHWYTYTNKDTVDNWNAYTFAINKDSVREINGVAAYNGVTWTQTSKALSTPVLPFKVCIYADDHLADGRYLRAAIMAVQEYSGREIVFTDMATDKSPDWLCWLSEKPLPADMHPLHIVKYTTGAAIFADTLSAGDFTIYKRHQVPIKSDTIIFHDYGGYPLIGVNGNQYTLYSHLHPEWNDAVTTGQLPLQLLDVIVPVPSPGKHDLRAVDSRQLLSDNNLGISKRIAPVRTIDLKDTLLLLLVLVLAVERLLSLKAKKEVANA